MRRVTGIFPIEQDADAAVLALATAVERAVTRITVQGLAVTFVTPDWPSNSLAEAFAIEEIVKVIQANHGYVVDDNDEPQGTFIQGR